MAILFTYLINIAKYIYILLRKNSSLMKIKIMSKAALGAFWATLAFTIFAVHDVLIKILGTTYSVFQIIFFATLFSFIPISAFMLADKKSGTFRPKNLVLVLTRSLFQVVGFICAFFSFTALDLAEAYSLLFVTPLLTTVFASLFLGGGYSTSPYDCTRHWIFRRNHRFEAWFFCI